MIFLSLGSNLSSSLGDRFYNINLAISHIESLGVKIIKKSSYYETPSYPDKSNPKFINIIIAVKTDLLPVDLMSRLILIEEKLERKRGAKNSPRTCDIDIIDYNNQVLVSEHQNKELSLPHKDLSLRNFVLFPLREISPEWKHPKTNEKIDQLINKLPKDDKNSILKVTKT